MKIGWWDRLTTGDQVHVDRRLNALLALAGLVASAFIALWVPAFLIGSGLFFRFVVMPWGAR